jgi:hypothetical protein
MEDFKIQKGNELTIKGTTKVIMKGQLTINNYDGSETIDVETTADLKDIPPEMHENFLQMLQTFYNKGYQVHDGWRNKDGSEVQVGERKFTDPSLCEKCGFQSGTFGKKLEKWLPFLFSHNCEQERKENL